MSQHPTPSKPAGPNKENVAHVSPARKAATPATSAPGSAVKSSHPQSPDAKHPFLGTFEGSTNTPSPFASGAPAPHPFGCACPTCVYYAAATLYMADFATPYALAQQYAYQGAALPPHVVAAHLQMQQQQQQAMMAGQHHHDHQSPQRAL
eukprot:CAMPEP_0174858524 /NCGR_PEP_ID=MMETSP1114-20130205/42961_1 /TAXON_ID=312471 /ORGANISM="Neobodo designis, Strain CCAP 1951/1" /LENGTH=149 /DNA_ID=CAMNT_0016093431 /DNA_START=29 /DNA_END=475 /DNA_ORIENTATION=+